MRRGSIVLVNLDPVIGAEASKTRPAIVVSNDGANGAASRNGHGVVTVVPVTSNVARVYPFQVRIENPALTAVSKAQAEQIRSVDVRRIVRVLGDVAPSDLMKLGYALRLHLGLGDMP